MGLKKQLRLLHIKASIPVRLFDSTIKFPTWLIQPPSQKNQTTIKNSKLKKYPNNP